MAEQRLGWFSRQQCAEFLGLKVDNLDKQFRRLLPETAVRKAGKVVEYHGPTLTEIYVGKRAPLPMSDDPLMDGSDSPALERYRAAKADLAELELATKRKELMPTGAVLETAQAFTTPLRALIQRWERRLRREEAQELRSAVERGIKKVEGLKVEAAKRDAASQN